MSKVTGPLLSIGASGQIAGTQVYAAWKGIQYARRYVIPANPQTAAQTLTRSAFKWLQAVWKFSPPAVQAAYDAYASSQPMTGRNAIGKFNISALRDAADIDLFTFSPGARSGFPASAVVLTPGSSQITVDVTAPTLPTGWTITQAHAAALQQQDPNTGTAYAMAYGNDASDPYSIVLSGLTPSQEYVVGGWFEYLRPDGKTAYGLSLNDTATPTA